MAIIDTITFYIGIDPKDKTQFHELFDSFNTDNQMSILGEWDALYDYYTFTIRGNWTDYKKFLHGPKIIKSVEHFEE